MTEGAAGGEKTASARPGGQRAPRGGDLALDRLSTWHGAGSWNNGAPIGTNEPQWAGRPPAGGGEWGWGIGPTPPPAKPFPIDDDPGSPPNGSSVTRARVNLKVECGGEPKKAFFFAIPAEGTGVHFVGGEFELTCTKC